MKRCKRCYVWGRLCDLWMVYGNLSIWSIALHFAIYLGPSHTHTHTHIQIHAHALPFLATYAMHLLSLLTSPLWYPPKLTVTCHVQCRKARVRRTYYVRSRHTWPVVAEKARCRIRQVRHVHFLNSYFPFLLYHFINPPSYPFPLPFTFFNSSPTNNLIKIL